MAGFPGKWAIHGRFYVYHLAGNYECAFSLGTKQPNMCCCLMVIANLWDWHGLATSGHFEFSYSANHVVQVFLFFFVAGINIYETRINPRCNPWCWNIYLHKRAMFGVNVGKYSSTMEHLGIGTEIPLSTTDWERTSRPSLWCRGFCPMSLRISSWSTGNSERRGGSQVQLCIQGHNWIMVSKNS